MSGSSYQDNALPRFYSQNDWLFKKRKMPGTTTHARLAKEYYGGSNVNFTPR